MVSLASFLVWRAGGDPVDLAEPLALLAQAEEVGEESASGVLSEFLSCATDEEILDARVRLVTGPAAVN